MKIEKTGLMSDELIYVIKKGINEKAVIQWFGDISNNKKYPKSFRNKCEEVFKRE